MKSRFPYLFLCLMPLAAHADNEDRLMQMRQDMEYRRQEQERQAVGNEPMAYGTAGAENGDDLALALLKAVNAQNGQETARLLAVYEALPDYDPDMVLFARANQAVWRDDLKQASALYRSLLQRQPQFVRGRLDLARLLFVDKQNQESKALFESVKLPDMPVINEKVKDFIRALEKRDAWNGSVSIGAGYDTNLNQSSENTMLRRQTSCGFDSEGQPILDENDMLSCREEELTAYAPEAEKGRMWTYEGGLNKRISLKGHHGIQLNTYAFGRLYPDRHEYSEHYLSAHPAYSFQNKDNSFHIGPLLQYEWQGGKLQNSSSGLGLGYSREWSPRASFSILAEHKYDAYRQEDLHHFNGPQTLLFATGVYALPQEWILFGGYDYLRKNSRERVDSYRRHGLRAGVGKHFSSGIETVLQGTWRKTAYKDYHAWLETRRRDSERIYQLDIKIHRPFLRGFTPALSLKHTRNKSSSWINRYKRNEVSFKIEYGF
ncbi:surface lipoprotein assembly modifier [Neisseria dentiae]|uniref:surface lipoprotein assembly modifier n=1 Tax=Neisseria dentiae TaxID=194197 RepID=UPI0035A0FBAC